MNTYIKSPLNYIGNKYRIIDQLQKHFPQEINVMVDLFCGGCDVTFNTTAKKYVANDINIHLIEIFKSFQKLGCEETLKYIDATIEKWNLSKDNKDAYITFRKYYNETRNPLDLYVLMCFSFNYQFRFNDKHEYNNTFGNARSSFNAKMRENLIAIFDKLQRVKFMSADFVNIDFGNLKPGDFVYADPPYLLTCGSYNDGKRGFRGWSEDDELELYRELNKLNSRGINFALSNVLEHKGKRHELLEEWINQNGYNLHHINFDYDNCNYHARNKNYVTDEVLITNY